MSVSSCSESEEPDRVVGVVLRCAFVRSGQPRIELQGADCAGDGYVSKRTEVTVKPAHGSVYTVDQPPSVNVKVGDPWPPK